MRNALALLLFACCCCGAATVQPPGSMAAEPHKDRCVIMVSVDGLAGFYRTDPLAEMPTLRRLAAEGAAADGLVCSFPTVTWPNHTTLVTGVPPAKHGVIGNTVLDRKTGARVPFIPDPLFDKNELVKAATVYDVAHAAGLVTAGIVWPATRNAPTLDWTVPDMFGSDAWPKYGTRRWLAELRVAGVPVDQHGQWTAKPDGGVRRDWLYTRMAAHVLEHHPPNLLLIHLVEVDHVQHGYGPRSPEAYWSVSYADDRLRDLVEAIGKSPYRDKTTLLVVSDHGFFPIEKEIRPNVLLKQQGLVKIVEGKAAAKQAWCASQGGSCMVYILDDEHRAEIASRLTTAFSQVEGIDAVIGPGGFAQIGQPTRDEDPHGADLWLAARSGYSFSDTDSGDDVVAARASRGGTHGYLPDQPDLLGTLVLSGYGIKRGAKLGKASNLDVAPTIALLLGLEMPTADGKALTAALEEQ